MLGDVVGQFGLGHDRELPLLAHELLAQVGPVGEHELHDVARHQQRRVGHLLRRHDRDAVRVDVLLVERIEPERGRRRRHGELDVVLQERRLARAFCAGNSPAATRKLKAIDVRIVTMLSQIPPADYPVE